MAKKTDIRYCVIRRGIGQDYVVDCWETEESALYASYRYYQEYIEKGFDQNSFSFDVQLVHFYNE